MANQAVKLRKKVQGIQIKTKSFNWTKTQLGLGLSSLFLLVGLLFPSNVLAATYSYMITYGNLSGLSTGACQHTMVYDPQFNTNIWNLARPAGTSCVAYTKTEGSYISSAITNRNYRMCAYIKGGGVVSVAFYRGPNWITTNFTVNTPSHYGYYCTGYRYVNTVGDLDGYVRTYPGAFVNVGGMVLQSNP